MYYVTSVDNGHKQTLFNIHWPKATTARRHYALLFFKSMKVRKSDDQRLEI